MFAGHVGIALAIGRRERRLNIGVFVAAALLLDFALWLFVLLDWETVRIPADFVATRQPEFVFPFTHGLTAALRGPYWPRSSCASCTRTSAQRPHSWSA